MKLSKVASTLCLVAATATTTATATGGELKVGDPAPDFTLQASDGKTYTLSEYRDKKAVVVAWSWCMLPTTRSVIGTSTIR